MRANLARRAERHPAAAATRSAGCVFRNPAGASAARAIDAAGLKGLRVEPHSGIVLEPELAFLGAGHAAPAASL